MFNTTKIPARLILAGALVALGAAAPAASSHGASADAQKYLQWETESEIVRIPLTSGRNLFAPAKTGPSMAEVPGPRPEAAAAPAETRDYIEWETEAGVQRVPVR